MKLGAYWEYLHDNGREEKVICSEKLSFNYEDPYNYKYVYKAHWLTSDYPYSELPQLEPEMNGAFVSDEFVIYRPFRDFCQKAQYRNRKILDLKFGEFRYQKDYDCSNGPASNFYITCLKSKIDVDSFDEVSVVLYSKPEAFQASINPIEDICIDSYLLLKPLLIQGNSAYSISWFAKGVGLIRRDIYQNQILVDRMRLTNYYFPE